MVQEGDHVTITRQGNLLGRKGIVVEARGNAVKVLIPGLGQKKLTQDDVEKRK